MIVGNCELSKLSLFDNALGPHGHISEVPCRDHVSGRAVGFDIHAKELIGVVLGGKFGFECCHRDSYSLIVAFHGFALQLLSRLEKVFN